MNDARTELIDEFAQGEIAVLQNVVVDVDFVGKGIDEIGLNLREFFGGVFAGARQTRIRLFPLRQFHRLLSAGGGELIDQFG